MTLATAVDRIRLGVSACLLGAEVRFDGGHKHDRFLTDVLGRHVEWVPVCPEVELDLGVPRDTLRLVGTPDAPRLVQEKTGDDLTARMQRYSRDRVRELAALELDGYVLKRASPSCGLLRVRVYRDSGVPAADGRGLFAEALVTALPALPVEEEGRLNDPALRENFIERVFVAARWRTFLKRGRARATSWPSTPRTSLRSSRTAPRTMRAWAGSSPPPGAHSRAPRSTSTTRCSWRATPSGPLGAGTPTCSPT